MSPPPPEGPGPQDYSGSWPGPPSLLGNFFNGLCNTISSCFYIVCCCWLLQDYFGASPEPPPIPVAPPQAPPSPDPLPSMSCLPGPPILPPSPPASDLFRPPTPPGVPSGPIGPSNWAFDGPPKSPVVHQELYLLINEENAILLTVTSSVFHPLITK